MLATAKLWDASMIPQLTARISDLKAGLIEPKPLIERLKAAKEVLADSKKLWAVAQTALHEARVLEQEASLEVQG